MSASDYRKLFKALKKDGWTVEKTRGGHFKCVAPDGTTLITPGSASDHRSFNNFLGDLRRYAGWDYREKRKGKKKKG